MSIVNNILGMKKGGLGLVVVLLLVSAGAAQKEGIVYSLEMNVFRNDTAELIGIDTVNGTVSHFPSHETKYTVQIISDKEEVLFEKNLGISFNLLIEPPGTGIPTEMDKVYLHIRLPVFEEADEIAVYHFEKKILSIDLSREICNRNKNCEPGENEVNCPSDCKETVKPECGDGNCDAGENYNNCPADCKKPAVGEPKEFPWTYLIIFVILLVVLILLVLRKRSRRTEGVYSWDEVYQSR
jgi:hypothetical protein